MKTPARSVVARSVVARSVVARSVVARSVVARSVVARSVVARSVVARSVVARSVVARSVVGLRSCDNVLGDFSNKLLVFRMRMGYYIGIPIIHVSDFKSGRVFALFPRLTK